MVPKHAQVMGNRIRSICHYKVMSFQPVSLQVTDVNVFLRKKKDFPLGVKMPRSAKDKPGNFLFLKLCLCVFECVCVCVGGSNNALLVLPVCTKTCI